MIDHKKAEKFILQRTSLTSGEQPTSVKCPSGVKAKAGGSFDCPVTYPKGKRGYITVHMLDAKGKIELFGPRDLHLQ